MSKLLINVLYLKYFCDAVRFNSISASGKENFVSQSAISQGISKLEKSLNQKLITHQIGVFRLTVAGQLIFDKSQQIFNNMQELKEIASNPADGLSGFFEFICEPSFAHIVLPKILYELNRDHPLIEYKIRLALHDSILSQVRMGIVDFGFIVDNDIYKNSTDMHVDTYRLCESTHEENHLKNFYTLTEAGDAHDKIIAYIKDNEELKGFNLITLPCHQVMASFISQGLGIGLLPKYIYRENLKLMEMHLKILLEDENLAYSLKVVKIGKAHLNLFAEVFLNLVKKYFTEL